MTRRGLYVCEAPCDDPPAAAALRAAVAEASAAELRAALLGATEIHFPDPQRATAGIHFAKVIDALGVRADVQARLRPHPNGATAMRALANSPHRTAVACTQKTEILPTPGVQWVDNLPREFELATVYSAGVMTQSTLSAPARARLALLGGPDTRQPGLSLGFEGH